ncbi:MAG: hypothetical protein N2C14_26680 [Planctomycetales bacterium]
MNVVLLTSDLMLTSQISSAAESRNFSVTILATADALPEDAPRAVMADLSLPGLDLMKVTSWRDALDPPPILIAFGPHVHEGKLRAAEEAGFDQVMPRGKFLGSLPAVLDSLR